MKAMGPPQEQRRPRPAYAIGDACRPSDMAPSTSSSSSDSSDSSDDDSLLLAAARLAPGDPCFVLRSGGRFTYAIVVARTRGRDPSLELQVDANGATKTIPSRQCGKYVRPLRRRKKAGKIADTLPDPRGPKASPRAARRRPSGGLSQSFTAPPPGRPGMNRGSSMKHLDTSGEPLGRRRPGLNRQASLHSGLNPTLGKSSRQPRRYSDFDRQHTLRSSLGSERVGGGKRRSAQARRRSSDLGSSILTHVPEGSRRNIVEELDELLPTGRDDLGSGPKEETQLDRSANDTSHVSVRSASNGDDEDTNQNCSSKDVVDGPDNALSDIHEGPWDDHNNGQQAGPASSTDHDTDDHESKPKAASDLGDDPQPICLGDSDPERKKTKSQPSSDDASPPSSPSSPDVIFEHNVHLSASTRRASLPGSFDIEFDEEDLARAFQTVLMRTS